MASSAPAPTSSSSTAYLDLVKKFQSGSHSVIPKLIEFADESDRNKMTLIRNPGFLEAAVAEIVKPGASQRTRVTLYKLLADCARTNIENKQVLFRAKGVTDATLKGVESDEAAVRAEALMLLTLLAFNDQNRLAFCRLPSVIESAMKSLTLTQSEDSLSAPSENGGGGSFVEYTTASGGASVFGDDTKSTTGSLFGKSGRLSSLFSIGSKKKADAPDSMTDASTTAATKSMRGSTLSQANMGGKRPSNLSQATFSTTQQPQVKNSTLSGGDDKSIVSALDQGLDSIANGLDRLGRATRVTKVGKKVMSLATGEAKIILRGKIAAFQLLEELTSSVIEETRNIVMGTAGLLQIVLQGVKSTNCDIQRHVFGLLANLASNKETKSLLFDMPDLVSDSIAVLQEGEKPVKLNAVIFLANLASMGENAWPLYNTPDLVESVMKILRKHTESSHLKSECFRLLLNLAAKNEKIKEELFLVHQLVEGILHAAKNGQSNEVKEFALNLLGNLACDCPKNSLAMAKTPDLIETILFVARDTQRQEIRNEAFDCLCQLAQQDENKILFASMLEVTETFLAAVCQHEREAFESKRLALDALALMSEVAENKVKLFEVPDLLLECMRAAKSGETKEIKDAGFKFVWELCLSLELRERMLNAKGVRDLLRNGIRSKLEKSRVLCILALGCIGGTDSEICETLRDDDCFEYISKCLQACLKGEAAYGMKFKLENILTTIRSLSGNRENRTEFGASLITDLETALNAAVLFDDTVSGEYALFALSQYAQDTDSDIWMKHKSRVTAMAAGFAERVKNSKKNWDVAKKIAQSFSMEDVSEMM